MGAADMHSWWRTSLAEPLRHVMQHPRPTRSFRERAGGVFKVLLAFAGVAAVALLIRQIGARELFELLLRALPWLPLLLLFEGGRIMCEAYGTRAICGEDRGKIDIPTWIRMHLVANSALQVLPAGRAICEGIKIASMSPVYGAPRAAGYVVMQHSMTMLALAIISVPCALAAYLTAGLGLLTIAVLAHGGLCLIGAVGLQIAARKAIVPKLAAKWFVHSEDALTTFRTTVRALPWVSPATLLGKLGNRVLQAFQFTIILHAIAAGGTVERGFLADGVNLVGAALGEFMPAQIGAMDGTFAIAAKALVITIPMAMAIANLARVVMLGWSAVGALVPMIGAREGRPSRV
jgi:hypothetical protein